MALPAARKPLGLERRTARRGWLFILPAVILIVMMSFYPMVESLLLSFQTGKGNDLTYKGLTNYQRLPKDNTYMTALGNTFFYLIVQVPIMLLLALLLASMLNDKKLLFKGLYRTMIFLPVATSLVSCSMIFLQIFSNNGLLNSLFTRWGWITEPIPFLTNAAYARLVIVLTMLWRWTGYNMVFYLAGLQNIDSQIYEAARIDGASAVQQFSKITVPLLRPIILFTTVLSTNGTLQLFDEVRIMTGGGPGIGTATLSFYIYRITFESVPRFGYAAAMSFTIYVMVAVLAFIQMRVGERKQ